MRENRLALQRKYGAEQVFALSYVDTAHIPDGFYCETDELLDVSKGKFVLRCDAEGVITFQQVIPCAVITDGAGNFFVSKRINGDDRLIGKLSITFGGHINPCDDKEPRHEHIITHGLERELTEETNIADTQVVAHEKMGYIRQLDSTTAEHIGVVYITTIDKQQKQKMEIKESDTLEGVWMNKHQLFQNYEKFEGWAKLIIAHLLNENIMTEGALAV